MSEPVIRPLSIDPNKTRFSPQLLTALISEPLKEFFLRAAPEEFRYSSDEKESKIEIASTYNFVKESLAKRPRILVDRGSYVVSPMGLTDSLSQALSMAETKGTRYTKHMLMYEGTSLVKIQTTNKGTAELLADMVSHVLVWTSSLVARDLNFKQFAKTISVSPTMLNREDTEIHEIAITFPWIKEEHFSIKDDGITINHIVFQITNSI